MMNRTATIADGGAAASEAARSGWSRLPQEYAIPDAAPSLPEAREYCRRLARSHYENFSVASWFLPKRLQQHFFNLYAYCRISDDLGDEVGDPEASLQLLDQWERELDACYDGSPRHPVFVALAETVRTCGMPKHEFSDLDCISPGPDDKALRNLSGSPCLLPVFGESSRAPCFVRMWLQGFRAAKALRFHVHRIAVSKLLAGCQP